MSSIIKVLTIVFLLCAPLVPSITTAEECCPCCKDHTPLNNVFFPHIQVVPTVAGWTFLLDFRARADEFGMDTSSNAWSLMVAIIDDYEDYYKEKINEVDVLHERLVDEELSAFETLRIIDSMYTILKAIDYRWVVDVYETHDLIPEEAWANYLDWFAAKKTPLNGE